MIPYTAYRIGRRIFVRRRENVGADNGNATQLRVAMKYRFCAIVSGESYNDSIKQRFICSRRFSCHNLVLFCLVTDRFNRDLFNPCFVERVAYREDNSTGKKTQYPCRYEAPYSTDLAQLGVKTMCSNRDLPMQIPLGQKRGDFTLKVNAPVETIRCVAGPTRPRTQVTTGDYAWRIINHLSLNFLSLIDENPDEGAAALRELLRLYTKGDTVTERHHF